MEIPALNANSTDHDLTPRYEVSDLSIHYLLMSFFGDARHKWFKLTEVHRLPFVWHLIRTDKHVQSFTFTLAFLV